MQMNKEVEKMEAPKKILLAGNSIESLVNGEGLRYVIFGQICKHNCLGCFNPSTHSPQGGAWVEIDSLLSKILHHPLIDGVTFSGGDPFEQAEAFYTLAKEIKSTPLSLWCYTGYTFEHLLKKDNPHWNHLLSKVDVLVDGPFIQALHAPHLSFRGSSNQRIIDVQKSLLTGQIELYELKTASYKK
jgi:anaerobic ribonucleoside-triphosphate reductase activating protein